MKGAQLVMQQMAAELAPATHPKNAPCWAGLILAPALAVMAHVAHVRIKFKHLFLWCELATV